MLKEYNFQGWKSIVTDPSFYSHKNEWCRANCSGSYRHIISFKYADGSVFNTMIKPTGEITSTISIWYFEDPKDASLFALRWL